MHSPADEEGNQCQRLMVWIKRIAGQEELANGPKTDDTTGSAVGGSEMSYIPIVNQILWILKSEAVNQQHQANRGRV